MKSGTRCESFIKCYPLILFKHDPKPSGSACFTLSKNFIIVGASLKPFFNYSTWLFFNRKKCILIHQPICSSDAIIYITSKTQRAPIHPQPPQINKKGAPIELFSKEFLTVFSSPESLVMYFNAGHISNEVKQISL